MKEYADLLIKEKVKYCNNGTIDKIILKDFEAYLKAINLKKIKTDADKKTFWINAYNSITILFLIKLNLKQSIKESPDFFYNHFVNVGGIMFSLDDIEHSILRNPNPKTNVNINDLEDLKPSTFDYRIHFALNCGGLSCPILKSYSTDNINKELADAEVHFVENNFKVDDYSKQIHCSPIFKWYQIDFPGKFLDDVLYKSYTIMLDEYNWDF